MQTNARTPDQVVQKGQQVCGCIASAGVHALPIRICVFAEVTPRGECDVSDNDANLWLPKLRRCCNCATVSVCATSLPVPSPCACPVSSQASSSRASMQSRFRDGPLSMEEKNACAHVLARAVDHRQLVEVLDISVMMAPPTISKEINSLASTCSAGTS